MKNKIRSRICIILCVFTIFLGIIAPQFTAYADELEVVPTFDEVEGFNQTYYCVGFKETIQLRQNGTGKVKYRTGNSTVASIDSDGNIDGLQVGRTHLYATVKGKEYQCILAVINPRLFVDQDHVLVREETKVFVTLKNRKDKEKITVSVAKDDVVSANVTKYEGDLATLVLTPKKAGTTTILIGRTNSLEQIKVNIKVEEPLTAQEIYKKCSKAMVEIVVINGEQEESLGSGFFINENTILTNYHVIKGAKKISVVDYEGEEFEVLNLCDYDESIDLAKLELDANHDYVEVSYENYNIGDRIYTIGSPYGLTGTFSTGIIAMTLRRLDTDTFYTQITAPISRGNSGGPLIDQYGRVIGVNSFTRSDGQNLNFAVPSTYFLDLDNLSPISIQTFYEQNS